MAICNLSELPLLLKKGACLLGIDPGSKTIGLAISDPGLKVAAPLTSITRGKFAEDAAAIARIIRERNIGGFIAGLLLFNAFDPVAPQPRFDPGRSR